MKCDNCPKKYKQIVHCSENQDNCPYHVKELLKSKPEMGIIYIVSGAFIAFCCYYPIYKNHDNNTFMLLGGYSLLVIGSWGVLVSLAGIYLFFASFFWQYLIMEKSNVKKRKKIYKFKRIKKKES
jgi:hypothetical protein